MRKDAKLNKMVKKRINVAQFISVDKNNYNKANNVIVDGTDDIQYIDFYVEQGLDKLRDMIKGLNNEKQGIKLIGKVGITSHYGDLLRLYKIPSYIQKQ